MTSQVIASLVMTIFSALAACTLITFESLGASEAVLFMNYWYNSHTAEWVRSFTPLNLTGFIRKLTFRPHLAEI